MQKTIQGYLDCLENERKYVAWRLRNTEDADWLFKYTIKEQELNLQIGRLRKWMERQGD